MVSVCENDCTHKFAFNQKKMSQLLTVFSANLMAYLVNSYQVFIKEKTRGKLGLGSNLEGGPSWI
jgi:hypothetical protein